MPIVAGVDFGTQSVRVSIVDSVRGVIGHGVGEYPVHRSRSDPDFATQSHVDHARALTDAMHSAVAAAGVRGHDVLSLAIDTTGSTVIPVDEHMQPLDDYYLWCDHRAFREAAEITAHAHAAELDAITWCGGVYSSEWGFSKLLHWLRHNPDKRARFASAFEHCDYIAAVLCGYTNPHDVPRGVCPIGHKWLWREADGGLPSEQFLSGVDPLFAGVREKLTGPVRTSRHIMGGLSVEWAERLGLRVGIPIPVSAFDAHWDAMGAGITEGDVVNVIGTSTCIMAMSRDAVAIPGMCGVVPGSIHPDFAGIEAGLSACGDIFDAIATRAGTTVAALTELAASHRAGQTGLLRMTWDNGDRTVLVNTELGGMTLGWGLQHTAADELFAAIEGTAFHTRVILDRMREGGVPIRRVIHGGGIPQKNALLNQVYANVLNIPVLVPERSITSLGSALFAFMAAGVFPTLEAAQAALCAPMRVIEPQAASRETYDALYALYRDVYFGFGSTASPATAMGHVLPTLRRLARR